MDNKRLQQRLLSNCLVDMKIECWEWQGQISNSGHGRITIRDEKSQMNKTVSAETASYLAFIGKIPSQCLIKQSCGNRLCINPEHLELIKY